MGYLVDKVEWDIKKDMLQKIRERVFVYELHIPKHIEFDSLDKIALHVLVTDDANCPIATGRLCKDGLIGRIASNQGIEEVSINCILNEVERFKRNGFIQQGNVFMEAGIPRQRMQCPVSAFNTTPFTLVH